MSCWKEEEGNQGVQRLTWKSSLRNRVKETNVQWEERNLAVLLLNKQLAEVI